MNTKILALQKWLNIKAKCGLVEDGVPGPATRNAVIEAFRNSEAAAITFPQLKLIADRLGCSVRQLQAVAIVESAGGGWDDTGLLKCLWERHWLWRRVKLAVPLLSDPKPGGYTVDADKDGINDSWEKLADASMRFGFGTAAECASFGKFQVMGGHWRSLGYPSVADMVWQLSRSEYAHYDQLARFVEVNGLKSALRTIGPSSESAREFARRYNGPGYAKFDYHRKIASAWNALR